MCHFFRFNDHSEMTQIFEHYPNFWELLGEPLPYNGEPIKKDLKDAEDAFRKLIYVMREEIAFEERRKEIFAAKEHN